MGNPVAAVERPAQFLHRAPSMLPAIWDALFLFMEKSSLSSIMHVQAILLCILHTWHGRPRRQVCAVGPGQQSLCVYRFVCYPHSEQSAVLTVPIGD